jgi:hypothetical protein
VTRRKTGRNQKRKKTTTYTQKRTCPNIPKSSKTSTLFLPRRTDETDAQMNQKKEEEKTLRRIKQNRSPKRIPRPELRSSQLKLPKTTNRYTLRRRQTEREIERTRIKQRERERENKNKTQTEREQE